MRCFVLQRLLVEGLVISLHSSASAIVYRSPKESVQPSRHVSEDSATLSEPNIDEPAGEMS